MKKSIFGWLILLGLSNVAICQTEHKCTVGLLDNRLATKLMREMDEGKDSSKAEKGFTQLGEFETDISEEVATSKSFKIPGSKQFVIASVYYTDESMGWRGVPTDSVYMGIAVSRKSQASAMSVPSRSLAEVNFTQHTHTMRVSTQALIRGRRVTAILECEWGSKEDAK